ncbi:CGNR zinc finger domain-containing protein [Beijerinckia mobilis]|uniref:CGNR zinc finger domain-containing protein n=1 Tax=Beijerinckia mobilis TaxID=231434 RepID=UPI001AEBBC76|nr:ABATE domain-containing protein [Beijerinckia mobilis]
MKSRSEFRFTAGRLSLDLAATLRRRPSERIDVLAPEGASARWLRDAGLVSDLLTLSPQQEVEIIALREAIWIVADTALHGDSLPRDAVMLLNTNACYPLAVPQLDAVTGAIRFIADNPFRTALASIARDAIELIGGPQRGQIKACEQPDCRMLFLDTSQSSRRRWCSMDRCGSRAKGAAFRSRHRPEPSGEELGGHGHGGEKQGA